MNSIKNSEKFNSLVKELASRLFRKKMNEITTTASIDTYQTPYAFGKKINKKRKKNIAYDPKQNTRKPVTKQPGDSKKEIEIKKKKPGRYDVYREPDLPKNPYA